MSKFYTVKKEINGTEYVAQFSGISTALRCVDESTNKKTGGTNLIKYAEYLFEHVIVEPKIKISDFGADRIGETKTEKIGDTEYTATFNGLYSALSAMENSKVEGTDNISIEKLSEYLFEKVITKPEGITIDDFDNMTDFNKVVSFASNVMQGDEAMTQFNEVVSFAGSVMQGDFRGEKDTKSTKAKGNG